MPGLNFKLPHLKSFGGSVNRVSATVPLLNYSSRIVQLGDSITQYGGNLATSILSYQTQGELETAASIKGNYNIDIWGSDSATNPGWFGADMGIAGQTLSTIGLRLQDCINLAPDALIIAGGTNDNIGSSTVASVVSGYTGMATTAHNAGVKHVFIRSIWPKGPTQSTVSTVSDQRNYNAMLKAFCDANSSWCHYVNVFDAVTNTDGTPATGVLQSDDLHPTAWGGILAGTVMNNAIEAVMDSTKNSSWLTTNFWATGNLMPSTGIFNGTSGTLGTGVTGTLPTGWTASGLTSTTIVASLVANAETGGQTLVLDVTPASGTGSETLTLTGTTFTQTANQWYRAWMECESSGRIPKLRINGGVTNTDQPVVTVETTNGELFLSGASGKLKCVAPPLQMTGSANAPLILIQIIKGQAPYRIKIYRCYVGPTTDPHITWGQTTLPVNTVAPSVTGTPGVGNVLTINPGTWTGLTSSATSARAFKFNLYRDGIFVSSTYSNGNLSYTQVAADAESVLSWTVGASNMAKGRSNFVAASNTVTVPSPTWKSAYDFIANTGKTNGSNDANSTAALTVSRSTTGYDFSFTTLFAANTARRTSAGLAVEPTAVDYKNFPSLPDNAGSWVYSNATCSVGGGSIGPEGSITSSRITFSTATGFARRTITSSANYRSAKFIIKGTVGQQVTLSYTPGQASTPNTSVLWTLTGGWDIIDIPNILAGNSSMVVQITNVTGQSSLVLDVVYVNVSIVGTGSATAPIHTPFPTTTAIASSGAETISVTIPASSTAGVFTFDDGSKQQVTVAAGTYSFPTTLTRRLLKSFKVI
jgi:hypothetical protein